MGRIWELLEKSFSIFEKIVAWLSAFLAFVILIIIFFHEHFSHLLKSFPSIEELIEKPNYLSFAIISLVFLFLIREILPTLEKIYTNIKQIVADYKDFKEKQIQNMELNRQIYKKISLEIPDLISLASGKTAIIQPSKHPEIWEGFINTYYVVNAPWQLEKFMETTKYRDMVELHAERYKRKDLKKTYYLLYTKNPFKDSIKNFIEFEKEVLKLAPEAKEKINVILIDEEAPKYSLFLGEKFLSYKDNFEAKTVGDTKILPYFILYLHEKPFIYKDGFPSWAFISTQADIFNILKEHILTLIHHAKEKSMEFPIEEFIKKYENKLNK